MCLFLDDRHVLTVFRKSEMTTAKACIFINDKFFDELSRGSTPDTNYWFGATTRDNVFVPRYLYIIEGFVLSTRNLTDLLACFYIKYKNGRSSRFIDFEATAKY